MSEINQLFETATSNVSTGTRGLAGTAQLTSIASNITSSIIQEMNADIATYAEAIKESQANSEAMDKLIEQVFPLADAHADFLLDLSDETIDGMLKSQQSKRSRCKSKAMTMDNYRSLMTAAIAENLIRLVTGKEKQAGGARRLTGSVEYTIEELQELESNQEKLKKEIRNVQSKKSIMKSKADFDESDERWQTLLKVEQQLKDMRVGGAPVVVEVEVDTTKNVLSDLLAGQDLHNLKAADSKELLTKIQSLIDAQ